MKIDFDETLITDFINLYNLVKARGDELSLTPRQLKSMRNISHFITQYTMAHKQEVGCTYPNWNGIVILQITQGDYNLAHLLQEIHYARLNHIVILCPEEFNTQLIQSVPHSDNIKIFNYNPDDPRYDIMKMIYQHFGHLHSVTIPIF